MATIAEKLAELAIVDDFVRNENPLLNVKGEAAKGTWVLLKPGKLKGQVETAGAHGWTPTSTFATGNDGAYYSKTSFAGGANYVASLFRLTAVAKPATGTRLIGCWVYRDKTSPETKENGYYLRVENISGEGAALVLRIKLEKWVEGKVTVLKEMETTAGKYKIESRFALVVGNGKVYAFASEGKATAFAQLLEAEDATYTEGYSAIFAGGTGTMAMQDFATGVLELEETAGILKPNAATVNVSAPNAEVVLALQPNSATVNVSIPSVELASGAIPSATEREAKGLPLPFPSVLANPGRLGPPRFNAADRKTLRIKR